MSEERDLDRQIEISSTRARRLPVAVRWVGIAQRLCLISGFLLVANGDRLGTAGALVGGGLIASTVVTAVLAARLHWMGEHSKARVEQLRWQQQHARDRFRGMD